MNEILIPLAIMLALFISIPVLFFIRGLKIRKRQKNEEQNRIARQKAKKFEQDRINYLKKNLNVEEVTKSSEFHKKYSGKKRYQKANPEKM